jgi:DNA-binding response OmpR family regulator
MADGARSILLIEDDIAVGDATSDLLQMHGYSVEIARTAGAGLANLAGHDLVLLDLGLPDLDGIEVCRRIRALCELSIIAVSARSDEIDKVLALRTGADDYIVKPYGAQELLARIEAVLRRSTRPTMTLTQSPARKQLGPRLELDVSAHRCWVDATEIALTRKEFAMLALLAEQPGVVVARAKILTDIWGESWNGAHRTLDVHASSLRTKLGDTVTIDVVRGVGYRLVF